MFNDHYLFKANVVHTYVPKILLFNSLLVETYKYCKSQCKYSASNLKCHFFETTE